MKRMLSLAVPLALAACSGSGTLDLKLTNGATTAAALTAAAAPATPPGTPPGLSDPTVESIKLPVVGADVHLGGGANPPDDGPGWHKVDLLGTNGQPVQTIDLVIARGAPTDLGAIDLPAGKITQIRLQLEATRGLVGEPGFEVIPGAVTIAPAAGSEVPTVCDLVVPHSAVKPGVKIGGAVDGLDVPEGGKLTVTLDFKLNEVPQAASGTSPCLYRLVPVLQIAKVSKS